MAELIDGFQPNTNSNQLPGSGGKTVAPQTTMKSKNLFQTIVVILSIAALAIHIAIAAGVIPHF